MSFSASLQRGTNFQPQVNCTIAAAAVSAAVSVPGTGTDFMIANVGSLEAFVAVGPAGVVAVAGGSITASNDGSVCIPGGAIMVLNFSAAMAAAQGAPIYVAAISPGGTTLRISQGLGD